jgi:hypothetical protein
MKKKSIFKKTKKKKEDFRAKKSAYLQSKVAYQACLFDSDEDEEDSNSDNDEDSNRSFSDYSSEGSNDSLHEGCEEWKPLLPHATHLFILVYWKQVFFWIHYRILSLLLLYYISI